MCAFLGGANETGMGVYVCFREEKNRRGGGAKESGKVRGLGS